MLRTQIIISSLFLACLGAATLWPTRVQQSSLPRRLTHTSEQSLNLNPSLSGDGRRIAFESTHDLAQVGGNSGFRALLSEIRSDSLSFYQIAQSRAVSPAISQDGSRIAFASAEDLVGQNPDRNFEIYLHDARALVQLTHTTPSDLTERLVHGSFQPSISDDGEQVAFSSNLDLVGDNPDLNYEVFLFNVASRTLDQLTSSSGIIGSTDAHLSGDAMRITYITRNSSTSADLLLEILDTNVIVTVVAGSASLKLAPGRVISDSGFRVVYTTETSENQTQVFLYDAATDQSVQVTALVARADDVLLNAAMSGDGKRITFATRRNVIGGNSDRSVELYLYDVPTGQVTRLTDAPSRATAAVVSALNDDGSAVVFNFPRVLSSEVTDQEFSNNSEIYLLTLESRPQFGSMEVKNGASLGKGTHQRLAPASIGIAFGNALAQTTAQSESDFPTILAGTSVTVNGRGCRLLFVSPTEVHFVLPAATEIGLAEVVVTNSDGFPSKVQVEVLPTAPGIFTLNGQGDGEGLILNADTLATTPFDPSDGKLRLIVFGTGIRNARNLQAKIEGRSLVVESIHPSIDLPGLDEVHLHVPSNLRGAGRSTLLLETEDGVSNPVTLVLGGSFLRDIMINEILADPPDTITGDANRDGVRSSADDEFIELINRSSRDIDLSGYEILTRTLSSSIDIVRHRFAPGSIVFAGTSIVVFGGGDLAHANPRFGGSQLFESSTGGLSLINSGGVVTLRDPSGEIVSTQSYGGSSGLRADLNQSITRAPDVTGMFALHESVAPGVAFSPGTRADGSSFNPEPAVARVVLNPSTAVLNIGGHFQFSAEAFDDSGNILDGVIFSWTVSDPSVATTDQAGLVTAHTPGASEISASARRTRSVAVTLTVSAPSPTPTPLPTPTPTPTPTPLPTPVPSPPVPKVVISEFRTRGPNGAGDEFIELYNNSDVSVDISGWKVRTSSSGGTISTRLTINSGTFIPSRGHFLATNSNGYSGTVAGDQAFASGLANDGGLALTLPDNSIVDQVGLSPGSAFIENMHLSPLPSDSNQSYERRPGGPRGSTQDTDHNFDDFQLLTPSNPENRDSSPTPGPSPLPSPAPSESPTPLPSPTTTPTPSPSPTPSPRIVISQVYGGGGNAGAPLRNDFIELFNSTTVSVNLDGWSVQYATATGSSWSVTNLGNISLAPGQYYLIKQASGGTNGADLPPEDVAGNTAMAATAGKVALVNSTTRLSGTCPASADIVDLVGYGTNASCFRGSGPARAPGNATSALRLNGGCVDTQNNIGDFEISAPIPRNSSNSNLCQLSTMRFRSIANCRLSIDDFLLGKLRGDARRLLPFL